LTFFANLAFALLLLGFSLISSSVGKIGFLVIIFNKFVFLQLQIKSLQLQILLSLLKIFFTILSSKEWKLITKIVQSVSNKFIASFNEFHKFSNSLFVSILIA
jgi:hypothetical protein